MSRINTKALSTRAFVIWIIHKDVFYCDEHRVNGFDIGHANGATSSPTTFADNFDDEDLHDGIPLDWEVGSSTSWDAIGGTLNSSHSASGSIANPRDQFVDFEADFDVIITDNNGSQSYWAGLAFRKANHDDPYYISGYLLYYSYDGWLKIYEAGGSNIASANTGLLLNAWRHVKVKTSGDNIKVYVNGNLELNIDDDTYTGGYFSFETFGTDASFDNFVIHSRSNNDTYYIRDVNGAVLAEYDGAGNLLAEYIYANGQRIAKLNSESDVDFYLNDHLGSARAMVGSNWSANYYPFGEFASQTGSDEDTHFDFTGHERDRDTGLIYAGARYYDAEVGRFVSVDRLADIFPRWTPYHYAYNNPNLFVDPTGDSAMVYIDNTFQFVANDGSEEITDYYFTKKEWEIRPDADGYISYLEGVEWLKKGGGILFADASKLKLSFLTALDFSSVGKKQYINLLYMSNIDEGLVFGNNHMLLLDKNGNVKVNWDFFDYNYHEYGKGKPDIEVWLRNKGIDLTRFIHRFDGNDRFMIAPYGTAKVPRKHHYSASDDRFLMRYRR